MSTLPSGLVIPGGPLPPASVPCAKCGGPIRLEGVDGTDAVDLSGQKVVHAVCPADERPQRWYEARLSVHVHEGPVPERFGEGGEELAHVRATQEARSFVAAVDGLDATLADLWRRVMDSAALVDQPVAEPPEGASE